MGTVVGVSYQTMLDNELTALNSYFSGGIKDSADTPGLDAILVFAEHERRAALLENRTRAADDLRKALQKISIGHDKLATAAKLDDSLLSLIGSYAQELNPLLESARTAFK